MGTSIAYEGARQQILVEDFELSIHHGLVKCEIESAGGAIDLLLPFNTFFSAVRTSAEFAELVDKDNRSRVVHACPACVCRGVEPV